MKLLYAYAMWQQQIGERRGREAHAPVGAARMPAAAT